MNLDLSVLFPSFASNNSSISAIFEYLVIAIFLYFVLRVALEYIIISKRVKHYSTQFSQYKGLDQAQFLQKRRELSNEAKSDKSYGALWLEFDESLVRVRSDNESRLYNVLDAAHFFNTHSLAEKLTENRLLAAVPGILTAVGVLGTFLGLSLGLGDFSNLTDQSSADEIKKAVFAMIGGAGIAFATSLYGVFFSLVFNFYEKWLERRVRQNISRLQNQIYFLFPRIVAEQTLSEIENHTNDSLIELKFLDEKIGNRLQETMQAISNEMISALTTALDKFVETAEKSSVGVFEDLINKFTSKIEVAATQQREALQKATEELARIPDTLKQMIIDTRNTLQDGITAQQGRDKERQDEIDNSLKEFLKNVDGTLTKLNATLANQITTIGTQITERENNVTELISNQTVSQNNLLTSIQNFIGNQETKNTQLLDDLKAVANSFTDLTMQHQQAVKTINQTSQNMQQSSDQFVVLSENLKTTVSDFSTKFNNAMDAVQIVTAFQEESLTLFDKVSQQFNTAGIAVEQSTNYLNQAVDNVEKGANVIRQSFNQFNQELGEHLNDLTEQVADLLSKYSQQVNNQTAARLNEWNEQTSQYTSTMKDAISTLSSIVDEIDGKVSRR